MVALTAEVPRVALFTDSFHEVNGVALTSRMLEGFARERALPVFSAHRGPARRVWREGSITRCEFDGGRFRLKLENDLYFDLAFLRRRAWVREALREFEPDLVHITGPSDTGILGAMLAHELGVPLVASWHTDIHKYAGWRLRKVLAAAPRGVREWAGERAESAALGAALRFFRLARLTLAPNPELTAMLERATGRPGRLMRRGVDTALFHPRRRRRETGAGAVVIGYAGRLSPEKNVRLLKRAGEVLAARGVNYRFAIAGGGSEMEWLRGNLNRAEFHGVLRGEALAEFYADLDIFAFPSGTDTYGNVVQEAMASGVPPVVMAEGGPKYIVRHGIDGLVARGAEEFCEALAALSLDRGGRERMAGEARAAAEGFSWERVFEQVWEAYGELLAAAPS